MRALCVALAITYVSISAVRAFDAPALPLMLRGLMVTYLLIGAACVHRLSERGVRAYTIGLGLLLPTLTLAATSLTGGSLTDTVFNGITVITSLCLVFTARDLLLLMVSLPVLMVATTLVLPPQQVELATRAGILGAAMAMGAGIAFGFQLYRGLLWEAEQAAQDAQLRAKESNAAKSTFLATMSHELRTPMMGVLGTADLLAAATTLGREEREYIHTIQESGRALLRVISDILDFSKVEAGALQLVPEPTDVTYEVTRAVTLMAPVAKANGLWLNTDVECEPPTQIFDRTRFRQIVLNLISNALKFTETGGVLVKVRSQRQGERDLVITCAVIDTGPGVPAALRDVIFEPFVQLNAGTARSHEGTGLGLAICARLARLMGGDIHVREAEGGGSVFEFTVLTRDAHDQAVDPHTGEVVLPLIPASSVLVVDDQEINRQVVVAMLRKMGYARVAVVHGGAEAVASLREDPVDVVLMDVQMPEVDGIEATRRILAGGSHAPYIVALTANALESDRQRCLEAGMTDYLAKPLTFDALRTVMFRAERAVRTQARRAP